MVHRWLRCNFCRVSEEEKYVAFSSIFSEMVALPTTLGKMRSYLARVIQNWILPATRNLMKNVWLFSGFACGIYTTNSPEACHFVADNCEANVIVVENDMQLQKILKVRERLPHLRAIVQYSGDLKEKYENVLTVSSRIPSSSFTFEEIRLQWCPSFTQFCRPEFSGKRDLFIPGALSLQWSEFMEIGNDVPDATLQERIKELEPNKCSTLIYTVRQKNNSLVVSLNKKYFVLEWCFS